MSRWAEVWNRWPRQFGPAEHLRQVGKTVDGRPVADGQIPLLINEIATTLKLEKSDVLLDLCCGNGLLTALLADRCQRVVGIDVSEHLIAVARRDHSRHNVSYELASVLTLPRLGFQRGYFTKLLMYDALQYFSKPELVLLLQAVRPLMRRQCLMMFGGLPYRPLRAQYLDTPLKRSRYWYYRLTGRDLLGTWWEERDLERACSNTGYQYDLHAQPRELYNSTFRVDVTIW